MIIAHPEGNKVRSPLLRASFRGRRPVQPHRTPHLEGPSPDFPGGSDSKAVAYNAGDLGLISNSGRSPGEGNGNPLQYSCLENPMDGGSC